MSNARKKRTRKSQTASLALAPGSARMLDQLEHVQNIRRVEIGMRIAVAHMDSLHSENNQLRAICADLLPWARGCTTSNPARAKAVKLAEAVVLPNVDDERRA